ncbi:MAG: hypothetical protein RLP44_11330 [Aggregatilineales bacterium]
MYGGDPGYKRVYTWRMWVAFMVIIFAIFCICGATVYVGLDVSCYNDAQKWLPDYPDAELLSEDYTFIRAFGVGETTRILFTTDDEDTVEDWYFNRDQTTNATGARRDDGIGFMRWTVREAGWGGTQIVLYSECSSDIIPW